MSENRTQGPLDRFLRLFTDVRDGEGLMVLGLATTVFLIFTAYYVLKVIRDTLILVSGSAELAAYIAAAQVIALIPIVRTYGKMADRFSRRRLVNGVTLFFIACLPFFWLASLAAVPAGPLAVVFYFWVGIFNVVVIAQFWSFANDVYSKDEGERLFPIVAFGASAGAVMGTRVIGGLIEPLGLYLPMVIAAGILIVELVITNWIDSRTAVGAPTAAAAIVVTGHGVGASKEPGRASGVPDEAREHDGQARLTGAFALLARHRYLLMIAFLILFLNWVNTTGEYIRNRVVEETAAEMLATGEAGGLTAEQQEEWTGEFIGSFLARFYFGVNLAGLLIQLFLVSRIIKYIGIPIAILFLPLISLGAYSLIGVFPALAVVRWAKTAENATDYSLNNTVRHALFLPTTREQKYKAKQAIDGFFWRAGDVSSAVVVFIGTTWLAMSAAGFARFNIILALLWLGLAWSIGRSYGRLTGSEPSAS